MDGIVPKLRRREKRRLKKRLAKIKNAATKTRYLIVINLADGRSVVDTAKAVQVSRSTVYRVAARYRKDGEPGLVDRREDNGLKKIDDDFLSFLYDVVADSPLNYGWTRPTWTQEMLTTTMARLTNISIHTDSMSRALASIGCRLGSPKPTVGCPWPKSRKTRRLKLILQLIENLPDNEVAVYEDEVDIHLNPKIGPDWMVPGQQKEVMTPGKNQKRYLAGAINAKTGELTWVEAESKNTLLFLLLLWELTQQYSEAKVIHVILDNYSIHSTQQVEISLQTEAGQRLSLLFLPPYCPDHNRIERLWKDMHADVTRNHACPDLPTLMRNVRTWLRKRTKKNLNNYLTA